ncbi:MAG: hypothetical protein WCG75_07345, partial [Armatimonadota bacterium]
MARVESFNLLLAKSGLDEVISVYNKNPSLKWKLMAPTVSTVQAYWRAMQEADFSIAPSVAQGSTLPVEDFETPYFKDFYPIKRALVAQNSRESVQSDLYGVIKRTGSKLNLAIQKAMEVEASAFVNLATDTSLASLGADGQPLASISHPYIGGVASNILANNPVLSYSSLESARTELMKQLSHKGDPMMFSGPFDLFVPPALMSVAERIVGSQTYGVAGAQGTAKGNDPNVMDSSRVRVVVNPWFTNATAWMLRSRNEDDHGLRFIT